MYKMVLRLDIGDNAENFSLKDQNGKDFSLMDLIGKHNIFLTFYTGGYDENALKFLNSLKETYPDLKKLDTEVVAITPELENKVKNTVNRVHLPFTVLSDPELSVSKQYDVYDPVSNWTYPAAFLINKEGVIEYSFRGASSPNTPYLRYIMDKLQQMVK
ncbi:peroxiredoxin [Methanocella sp. CWC-04]|uniref:Peroxiredoxin n=1 Tax=Methanooceanicella nereidis TaxID=2052831 RepID=A0AAP2RDI0_9EURY|nr:peroxiredoxin family protein [Methanocella sp. CWC-04]MCD1295313.1 peroxiredoxin [Methanocella sp. CWC-04]